MHNGAGTTGGLDSRIVCSGRGIYRRRGLTMFAAVIQPPPQRCSHAPEKPLQQHHVIPVYDYIGIAVAEYLLYLAAVVSCQPGNLGT